MRHLPFIVLRTALVAALAACGGPSSPPPPPEPDAVSVTPMVAARGETIVVAGSGFGAAPGTVTVGGAQAVVTQWTDVSITASVADGTPNAWGDVIVTTDGGSDTVAGLFVGAEFTGDASELQAFLDDSPLHSAVLLQAASYDLSPDTRPFIVDNVDVYGRGADLTTITQPTSQPTAALADTASTTTIADVTLEGDDFVLARGSFRDTIAPFAVSSGSRSVPADATAVEALFREAAARAVSDADASLSPAAVTPATIVFDGVTYQETGSGVWGLGLGLSVPLVDLVLRGSTLDLPTSVVAPAAVGDVLVESSEVTAAMLLSASILGELSISDSTFTSLDGATVAGQTFLSVADSTLRVTNGALVLSGVAATTAGGASVMAGGPVEIRGSIIEALDAAPLDGSVTGGLRVETAFAPIIFAGNELIRSHHDFLLLTLASVAGEGDIELTGNADVRVGIFTADDAGAVRQASLSFVPASPQYASRVTVDGNTIATTGDIRAHATPAAVNVYASNNTISVGDGALPASVRFGGEGPGVVEVVDNVISATSAVYVFGGELNAEATTVVSGNTVTSVSALDGGMVIQSTNSCVVTDNVVEAVDTTAVAVKNLVVMCIGSDPLHEAQLSGNEVTTTGSLGSGPVLMLFTPEQATVDANEFDGSSVTVYTMSSSTTFTSNTVVNRGGPIAVTGDSPDVTIAGNTVTHHSPSAPGLHLVGLPGTVSVTGNTFTGIGTPTAAATALEVWVGSSLPMTLTATGNTFTNYGAALRVQDGAPTATGIDATINGNVFDFPIDTVGAVATLVNVKDVIDAKNNQWGSNTDLATVEGLVQLDGNTASQGGDIDLDPITQP